MDNDTAVLGGSRARTQPLMSIEGGKAMSEFTVVLEEGELEAGAMRVVDIDGIRVLVSRSEDGGVCHSQHICTHRGGPLGEGERDGNVVTCPWHGSRSTCALGQCCGDRPESPSGASSPAFARGR